MARTAIDHELPPALTQPVIRALTGAGIKRVQDVSRFTEAEIPSLHGIGPKFVRPLEVAMIHTGIKFRE
jgi:hypothetical protein